MYCHNIFIKLTSMSKRAPGQSESSEIQTVIFQQSFMSEGESSLLTARSINYIGSGAVGTLFKGMKISTVYNLLNSS